MKYKKDAAGERAVFLKTCLSDTLCHMFDHTFNILLISFTKVSLLVMFVSFLYWRVHHDVSHTRYIVMNNSETFEKNDVAL